jgi:ABC-type multidrug transport system permease subunit
MINIIAPFHQGILFYGLLEVYITLTITALAGMMLGLAISAAVPNNDTALSFIPIILVPQVIFSGTIFPLKDPFSQAVGALFAARWSMIALGSSVGLHSDKLMSDKLFGNDYTYHGTLFSLYSQQDDAAHLLFLWGALLLMIVLSMCTTFIAMKRKDVRK